MMKSSSAPRSNLRGVDNKLVVVSSTDSFPWLKAVLAVVVTNVVTLTLCRQYQTVVSWYPSDDSTSKGVPVALSTSSSSFHENLLLSPPSVNDLPSPSTTLAFQQSLGFFDDIDDDIWVNVYQRNFRTTPHYLNPQNPNTDVYKGHNTAYWQYYNWIPNFSCPRRRKIGGVGDGPKWVCDADRLIPVVERRRLQEPHRPDDYLHCLIYSIGSNGDYSFEEGLVDTVGKICEIHIFDPGNFEKPGLAKNNMHYHPWGLTSSDPTYKVKNDNFFSIQEIQKMLGHENRVIDIFKIDCEGCEWTTYQDWLKLDMRQILLETHYIPVPGYITETFKQAVPKGLTAADFFDEFEKHNYVLFQRESNSYYGGGECYEWAWLKMAPEFFFDGTLSSEESE